MLKLNENNCPVEVVKCYSFGAYTLLFGLWEHLAFNISPVKPNGFFGKPVWTRPNLELLQKIGLLNKKNLKGIKG